MLQALDVTAETDGRSPQRTEYRPFGSGSALGQAWPAIGAVLLLLIILGGCLVWHWRRRSRRLQRICDAILERCRSCRQGSSRYPSTVRLLLTYNWGPPHVSRGKCCAAHSHGRPTQVCKIISTAAVRSTCLPASPTMHAHSPGLNSRACSDQECGGVYQGLDTDS